MDYHKLSPTELAIACLSSGEEAAWAEFICVFNPMIAGVVMRVARNWNGATTQVVEDLVQETYLKLCAERFNVLARFDARRPESIFAYLKVFAANVAHDHFKAANAKKRGGNSTSALDFDASEASPGHESQQCEQIERWVMIQQIDAFLKTSETGGNAERDRQIFWLYYRTGLTATAIADIAGVNLNIKGVESTIFRLTRRVRAYMTGFQRNAKTAAEREPREGLSAKDSLFEV